MLFANQHIRTPLVVGGEVAVLQVVTGEALVASGVLVFEHGEGGAGGAVDMHIIWGQHGGGADGIYKRIPRAVNGRPRRLSWTTIART